MAKKTLEARLRMVDETQAATRSASASARALTGEYEKLDKAIRQAMRKTMEDRRAADRTIERQRISNLEREVRLGREGASVELEKARATAAYRREREALLSVMKSETATVRQKAAAEQELVRLNLLHLRGQARAGAGAGAPGIGRQMLWRGAGFAAGMIGAHTGGEMLGNLRRAGDETVGFETHMKDLLTVGDNSGRIDAVRQKVLDLSAATGRAREEIANLLFFIESGTVGMPGGERGDIERNILKMGRTTTTPLDTMGEAMIKGWRAFGKELQSVDQLADKFFTTVERGFLTHGELARYITQVLSSGDAFNFSLDELLAVTSVGTKGAADAQTALTSIRNIILQLNKAQEHGIQLSGGLIDQLEQVSQLDPQVLADLFGKRNATVLFDLVKRTKELRVEMEAIGSATGVVDKRLTDLAKNGTHALAMMMAGFKEAQKNALLGVGTDPGTQGIMTDFEAARMTSNRGWAALLPEWMKDARAAARTGADASVDGYLERAAMLAEADDEAGARAALQQAERLYRNNPTAEQAAEAEAVRATLENRAGIRAKMAEAAGLKRQNAMAARAGELSAAVTTNADLSGRTTATQRRWMEMLAGDKDGSVAARAQAIVAAANKSGRTFDEQASIAEAMGSLLGQSLKRAFGAGADRETVAKKMAEVAGNLFGERASLWDRLMGRNGKSSTALPVIGEMLGGVATRILGRNNAAFLGIGEGDGRGPAAFDFDGLRRSRVAEMSVANSGFRDAAGRARTEERMQKVWQEISDKLGRVEAAIEEMTKQWGDAPVLMIPGA